jgi:hypothetical protein
MLQLGVLVDPVANEWTGRPDPGVEPLHVVQRAGNKTTAETTSALDFRNESMAKIEDFVAQPAVLQNGRAACRFQYEATRLLIMSYVHVAPFPSVGDALRTPPCMANATRSGRRPPGRIECVLIGSGAEWHRAAPQPSRQDGPRDTFGAESIPEPMPERRLASKGKPWRSYEAGGYEILVGKGARENDELSLREAAPHDLWLHAAGYAGSHVVIRNPERLPQLPREVVETAAALAAWHSKARESRGKIDVHVCRAADVSKPRGYAPGKVIIRRFDRLRVYARDLAEPER